MRFQLEELHGLSDLEIVEYWDLAVLAVPEGVGTAEQVWVEANAPSVSPAVVATVKKYPYSNFFNVERLTVRGVR